MTETPHVAALRVALAHSPENLPLKKLLADALVAAGESAESERLLRALSAALPEDVSIKASLAQALYLGGKASQALVLAESADEDPNAPPAVRLLLAKLRFRMGERAAAADAYERAIEADPELADPGFADELNLGAKGDAPATDSDAEWDEDDAARVGVSSDGAEGASTIEEEHPKTTFADVGGMEALKEEIRLKIIHPLRHPEIYAAYGKKSGGGVLLYGPPGCGKTRLARATAGEIESTFIVVGVHDVLQMWLGNSEKALHEVFQRARRAAPCVVFFDEIDALAANRNDARHWGGRTLVNQFLSEMDGVAGRNEGVLVLGATNAPWSLDDAFRRPGRFDRVLFVPPPDEAARASILAIHLKDKPTESIDHAVIAKATRDFSGADMMAAVDLAVEAKLRDAVRTGKTPPLSTKDLLRAAERVAPSTREWFATAKNYVMFANTSGLYDDVAKFMKLR